MSGVGIIFFSQGVGACLRWSSKKSQARPPPLFGQYWNDDLSPGLKLQELLWLSEDFYLAKGEGVFKQSEVFRELLLQTVLKNI